jgi:uncharacterized membrane-anchored protein YjiN (DUF445 family)
MRNKRIADSLIIALILCFAVVMYIKVYIYDNYYMDMLTFVIEAALVGGIADWFAVTALYKKPLGFPHHTAIIPRNREKVIKAISSAVENELLSHQTLQNKIKEVNFTEILIKFIDKNIKNDGFIIRLIEKYGVRALENIDSHGIAAYVDRGIGKCLREMSLQGLLNRAFAYATENNNYEKPFEEFIDYFIIKVQNENAKSEINKMISNLISENIESKKGIKKTLFRVAFDIAEGSKSVNIEEIAESIQKEIGELLLRLKDLKDPLHIQMIHKIQETINKLEDDDYTVRLLEEWKSTIIENVQVKDEINNIIKDTIFAVKFIIEKDILKGSSLPDSFRQDEVLTLFIKNISTLIIWMNNKLLKYWEVLKMNETAKVKIESYLKSQVLKFIESQHKVIGYIVEKSLGNLTDDALNSFIEEKAGNDLHWIRINGCIVGGAFGLLVFLFVNEIYMPIISKFFYIY